MKMKSEKVQMSSGVLARNPKAGRPATGCAWLILLLLASSPADADVVWKFNRREPVSERLIRAKYFMTSQGSAFVAFGPNLAFGFSPLLLLTHNTSVAGMQNLIMRYN